VNHPPTHHALRITFHVLRFALLLLLLAPTPTHAAQETVAVTGRVTNGTPGGTVPERMPVTLHVFTAIEEAGTYTTTVAADGAFHFDGLALVGEERLITHVVYQDVDYTSEVAVFEPGQREIPLSITIYDTTDDPGAIQVAQLHVFVEVAGDRLWIAEHYQIGSAGDRTYAGALPFTLPQNALDLRLDDELGTRYQERAGGFSDTRPVPPGPVTSEVYYSYELPYQAGMAVERDFLLPVASAALVVTGEGITLEGAQLTPEGSLDTDAGQALVYSAGPLAVGETLAFRLGEAVQERRSGGAGEIAVGLAALVVAAGLVYLLWRPPAPGPVPARVRPLVQALAALDAHALPEQAYRRERKKLVRRIQAILETIASSSRDTLDDGNVGRTDSPPGARARQLELQEADEPEPADGRRFYSVSTLPHATRRGILDGAIVKLNPALITITDGLVEQMAPEVLQGRVRAQVELLLNQGKVRTFHVDVNFADYGGFGPQRPEINTAVFTPEFLARLNARVRAQDAFLNLHLLTDRPHVHLREFAGIPLGAVCFQLDAVREPAALVALVRQIADLRACASPVIETVGTPNRLPLSVEAAFALLEPVLPEVGMLTFQAAGTAARSSQAGAHFDHVAPYVARARRAFAGTIQIQGGVTTATIGEAVKLGAEFLVCGTQIFCHPEGLTPPEVVDRLLAEAARALVDADD
jgi:pentose-5-phosphate-3-epimerase